MKEYIISWNTRYGEEYEIINANNEDEAQDIAYEYWNEDIQNQADYGVIGEATEELKEKYL